eukprot:1694718-Pyramimonas_sp.AAC.1
MGPSWALLCPTPQASSGPFGASLDPPLGSPVGALLGSPWAALGVLPGSLLGALGIFVERLVWNRLCSVQVVNGYASTTCSNHVWGAPDVASARSCETVRGWSLIGPKRAKRAWF